MEYGGVDEIVHTQRNPGSTRIRVDPEGQPGKNYDKQSGGINTHHVEANLSP